MQSGWELIAGCAGTQWRTRYTALVWAILADDAHAQRLIQLAQDNPGGLWVGTVHSESEC